jgi:hypothetical protein
MADHEAGWQSPSLYKEVFDSFQQDSEPDSSGLAIIMEVKSLVPSSSIVCWSRAGQNPPV